MQTGLSVSRRVFIIIIKLCLPPALSDSRFWGRGHNRCKRSLLSLNNYFVNLFFDIYLNTSNFYILRIYYLPFCLTTFIIGIPVNYFY